MFANTKHNIANNRDEEDGDSNNQKRQMLELRRLLYCMEQHENMVQETQGQQSWQSILLRAQLLQDKWQTVATTTSASITGSNRRLRQDYQELSQRVDAACLRARDVASMEKEKAEQQQQKRSTAFGASGDDDSNNNDDIIERLFFPNTTSAGGTGQRMDDNDDENDAFDDGDELDDFLQDEEESVTEDRRRRSHGSSNENQNNYNATDMQELQEAQREQMEHAISLMAKQMKEATQGIQSRLKQQNETTLNQLETVAEQNVQDVTQVAQNVKDHNIKSRRSNWATWTLLFTLVGVFFFTLMAIFTIPKSPNACLLCIGKQDSLPRRLLRKATRGISLTSSKIQELVSSFQKQRDEYGDDDDGNHDSNDVRWKGIYDEDAREREEKERLEKLLLDLRKLEKVGTGSDTAEAVEIEEAEVMPHDDNPWGIESEDDKAKAAANKQEPDNPWGIEAEDDKSGNNLKQEIKPDNPWGLEAEEDKHRKKEIQKPDNPWGIETEDDKPGKQTVQPDNPWGLESEEDKITIEKAPLGRIPQAKLEQESSPTHVVPEKVNVDDIFASLREKMKEAEDTPKNTEDQIQQQNAEPSASPAAAATDNGFDPTNAFERDGAASARFSPRDFRVKAATNDYETLQRFISISTEHMNRQDRNGWSALHFAARSGHLQIIELLLEHGADPLLENNDGQSCLQVAEERFDIDHPIVRTFYGFIHGAEEDVNNDENDDDDVHEANEAVETEEQGPLLPENAGDSPISSEEKVKEERRRRKKMFEPVVDDSDHDVQTARGRLDDLLNQPPRKSIFSADDDDEL